MAIRQMYGHQCSFQASRARARDRAAAVVLSRTSPSLSHTFIGLVHSQIKKNRAQSVHFFLFSEV
jgi:hypothetical protein